MHASPLSAWESFYVIVGSSAGALTGLQFVVIALIAEIGLQGSGRQISAFGTPTVVHFCVVLLLGAILSAPWRGLAGPALATGAVGVAGIVYAIITVKRAVTQSDYKAVFEDWVWHTVLPTASYVTILIGALKLRHDPSTALFLLGAAALLLLFIGIRNAWDTVTYVVVTLAPGRKEPEERG